MKTIRIILASPFIFLALINDVVIAIILQKHFTKVLNKALSKSFTTKIVMWFAKEE